MSAIQEAVNAALDTACADAANMRAMSDGARWLAIPVVRAIAKAQYGAITRLTMDDLFGLCEALLETGDPARRTIAFVRTGKLAKR